tara:strand:+ start:9096 stop:11237 length:2142 start_codon:yes stop_codon:yes gene_type:complete
MTTTKKMLQAAAGFGVDVAEPVGVDFDGTNDYLSRSSDLVGNADGKTFTFSCWFYLDPAALNTNTYKIYDVGGGFFRISIANGNFVVQGTNGISQSVRFDSTSDVAFATWTHVLISVDLTNSSNRYVYMNDQTFSGGYVAYANQVIGFAKSTHKIGRSDSTAGEYWDGRLAGVYLDYTYRDLSVEANRRLFIDADGLYVTPPTSGIISVPMDDPADVGRNDGTGGDFTLNGTVARSGRGPNQYNAVASTFNGSADYLTRGALVGATASPTLTISLSLKMASLSTSAVIFNSRGTVDTNNYSIRIQQQTSDNRLFFTFKDSTSGSTLSNHIVENIYPNVLYSVSASFDTSGAGNTVIMVNGQPATVLTTTDATGNIDLAGSSRAIHARFDGVATVNTINDISNFYLDDSYIDLATDNPFWDSDTNKPKYLGANGELPTGSSPLIYLPLRADDAGNNLGTGGDFTVNSGPFAGARGASEYIARSASFNGTSQSLAVTSSQGGMGFNSSRLYTIAVSLKPKSSGSRQVFKFFGNTAGAYEQIELELGGGDFSLKVNGSTGATILNAVCNTSELTLNEWHNVLISIDLSSTGTRNFYINGVVPGSINYRTYNTSGSSNLANLEIHRIAMENGNNYFDGDIAMLYISQTYIDFSQEANRLKFFDGLGYPVDLGEDGSIPTDTSPQVYMNKDFHLGTNSGTGLDFTPNNSPTIGSDVKG